MPCRPGRLRERRCGISARGSSRRSSSSSSSGEPQLRFRSSPARLSHRDRAPVVHGCNRCHAIAPRRHARCTPPYSRLVLAGIADYCARAVCRRVPLPLLPTPQRCALWPGLRVSGSAGFGRVCSKPSKGARGPRRRAAQRRLVPPTLWAQCRRRTQVLHVDRAAAARAE